MQVTIEGFRRLMEEKQSNLSVAADFERTEAILSLAENIGDHICLLKLHVDIIEDFSLEFIEALQEIANRKRFLIFEDRKFADIGETVRKQFSSGIFRINQWADFINAHTLIGPGIIEGLQQANRKSALILLAQMTPKGNLFTRDYLLKTVELAKKYAPFVIGFIGSADKPEHLALLRKQAGKNFLIFTPGIKLSEGGDALSQTYNTPEKAISLGSDIIIVGRGITQSKNPQQMAQRYQKEGWKWYQIFRKKEEENI